MLSVLAKSIREYKKPSLLAPLLVSGEVVMECIIPFVTANLVNQIKAGCSIGRHCAVRRGAGGDGCAVADLRRRWRATPAPPHACGFARNLRKDMFYRIQDYSFENIDKFSVSSLVTRMTTDVANVQMAYMMIIRMAIRGPLMLIFSFIMGVCHGRQDGHDLPGCHPAVGRRAGAGDPQRPCRCSAACSANTTR